MRAIPVAESERLQALDVLRGCAVLGILLLNIQLFTMPMAAYFNPYWNGEPSPADLAIWSINHLFADQKFMTMFSLLFGAGILLMTARAEERGTRGAALHYRRMACLLLFGLVHAYVLWHGDILVLYAVCGMLVFPFRRLTARTLVTLGVVSLAIGSAISIAGGLTWDAWPQPAIEDFQSFWAPTAAARGAEIAAFQGGYLEHLRWRAAYAFEFHTFELLIWGLWRAGGLMLLGMGLFKLGVLQGARSARFHARQLVLGLVAGVALTGWGLAQHHATGWNVRDSFFLVAQWNYWGSVLTSFGWMGLLITLWRAGAVPGLIARLTAIGRMAFSCYILETLLATFTFYGHGLGLFGTVNRTQQMLFTVGVWAVLLLFAPWWLARFQYGPLEWLWRTMTYGRAAPMKRAAAAAFA